MITEEDISQRQRQIAHLAADGLTDKEIGSHLGISASTLRTYWERLRLRMEAKSRTEIVARLSAQRYDRLRSENDELLQILKSLPQFVWTADPSGYVQFCNDWFASCGGLSASEYAGKGCRALMLEEDYQAGSERWNLAQESEQGYQAHVRFKCGGGNLRWHLIRLFPLLTRTGEVYKWVGTGHEVHPNYLQNEFEIGSHPKHRTSDLSKVPLIAKSDQLQYSVLPPEYSEFVSGSCFQESSQGAL